MKIVKSNTRSHIKAKFLVNDIKSYYDTKNFQDMYYRARDYKDFLEFNYKNPTVAEIAYQEALKPSLLKYPKNFIQNMEFIKQYQDIRCLREMVIQQKDTLYEKTRRIRETLIKNDRFSLDWVKPKIESKSKKLLLKIKSLF